MSSIDNPDSPDEEEVEWPDPQDEPEEEPQHEPEEGSPTQS